MAPLIEVDWRGPCRHRHAATPALGASTLDPAVRMLEGFDLGAMRAQQSPPACTWCVEAMNTGQPGSQRLLGTPASWRCPGGKLLSSALRLPRNGPAKSSSEPPYALPAALRHRHLAFLEGPQHHPPLRVIATVTAAWWPPHHHSTFAFANGCELCPEPVSCSTTRWTTSTAKYRACPSLRLVCKGEWPTRSRRANSRSPRWRPTAWYYARTDACLGTPWATRQPGCSRIQFTIVWLARCLL